MVKIRKSTGSDIDGIMRCYDLARQFMRASGNDLQWINGYPSRELVSQDIADGISYVGVDHNGEIAVTFVLLPGDDPTYAVIEGGAWLNDLPYATIHRLGSSGKYRGMLKLCVDYCASIIDNLRLDTHEVNHAMRHAAERLGFTLCGTIHCYDGTPRLAYQRYNPKPLT